MTEGVENQHFVPKVYLKQFTNINGKCRV